MKWQASILSDILLDLRPTALPSTHKAAHNVFKQEVREYLQKSFPKGKYTCGDPFEVGSTKKKTTITLRYDLDLFVPFSRSAYHDEKSMVDSVHKALLAYRFHKNTEVRRQRVSVGLLRYVGSQLLAIDVVPGMEKRLGAFQATGPEDSQFLVLYDRVAGKPVTTNVHRQLRIMKQRIGHYRDVIRLLKAWRFQQPNEFPLGSYAIEMMVYDAATSPDAPRSGNPAEFLHHVLQHCIQCLYQGWELIEVGTGKRWNDYLSPGAKTHLAGLWSQLLRILQDGDEEEIRQCFLG